MDVKAHHTSERVVESEEETVKDKVEEDFITRMGPVLKQALKEDFHTLSEKIGDLDTRLKSIEVSSRSTATSLENISRQLDTLASKFAGRQAGSAA
jgi:mevalonate kinase